MAFGHAHAALILRFVCCCFACDFSRGRNTDNFSFNKIVDKLHSNTILIGVNRRSSCLSSKFLELDDSCMRSQFNTDKTRTLQVAQAKSQTMITTPPIFMQCVAFWLFEFFRLFVCARVRVCVCL